MFFRWYSLVGKLVAVVVAATVVAGVVFVVRAVTESGAGTTSDSVATAVDDTAVDDTAIDDTAIDDTAIDDTAVDALDLTGGALGAGDPAWHREELYRRAVNAIREQTPVNLMSGDGWSNPNAERLRVLVVGGGAIHAAANGNFDDRFGVRLEQRLDATLGDGASEVQVLSDGATGLLDRLAWLDAVATGDRSVLPISATRLSSLQQRFDVLVLAVEDEDEDEDEREVFAAIDAFGAERTVAVVISDGVDDTAARLQQRYADAGFVVAGDEALTALGAREVVAGPSSVRRLEALHHAYASDTAAAILAAVGDTRAAAASAGATGRESSLVSNHLPLSLTIGRGESGGAYAVRYDGTGGDQRYFCVDGSMVTASTLQVGTLSAACVDGDWRYTDSSSDGAPVGAQVAPCAGAGRPHGAIWLRAGMTGDVEIRNDGTEPVAIAAIGTNIWGVGMVGPWTALDPAAAAVLGLGASEAGVVTGFAVAGNDVGCSTDTAAALGPFEVHIAPVP